jgi:hypothetical protein
MGTSNILESKNMKKLITSVMALTLGASAAMAGGPIVIEEENEVVAEKPASSVGILPIVLIAVGLCLALCGNDDDPAPVQ